MYFLIASEAATVHLVIIENIYLMEIKAMRPFVYYFPPTNMNCKKYAYIVPIGFISNHLINS